MDGPILVIDRDAALPIGVQLVDGLRRGILDGAMRPGDPVPSTRALAAELGVSRSAVVAAYEQLAGEGYLEMRQGAPTRVAALERGHPGPAGAHRPGGGSGGPDAAKRRESWARPAGEPGSRPLEASDRHGTAAGSGRGPAHRPAAGPAVDRAHRHARVALGVAARRIARHPVGVAAAVRRRGAPRAGRRPPPPGPRRRVRGRRRGRHGGHQRGARARGIRTGLARRRRIPRSPSSIPGTPRRGAPWSGAVPARHRWPSTPTGSWSRHCDGCRRRPTPSWSRRATSTRSAGACRWPPGWSCSTGRATSAPS